MVSFVIVLTNMDDSNSKMFVSGYFASLWVLISSHVKTQITTVLLRKSVMHPHHAFKPLYGYFEWNRSCDNPDGRCTATTLENKVAIALPSQTSLTMLEMEWWQRNLPKNLFAILFSCSCHHCGALSSLH